MTGCTASHLYGILVGRGWAWRVRSLVNKVGLPPAAWDGNAVPLPLLPSKAQRRAARKDRKAKDVRGGEELAAQRADWRTQADKRKNATGSRSTYTGAFSGHPILPGQSGWGKRMIDGFALDDDVDARGRVAKKRTRPRKFPAPPSPSSSRHWW